MTVRTAAAKSRAKLNLLLSVVPGAQADGYHAVTTVMCPLELADDVRVREGGAPGVRLTCTPDPLPAGAPPERNIAHRAAVALAGEFGREPALDIEIRKVIPSQAGLGGGSSNAAAVIRCLARLWGIDPFDGRLLRVAASLGADVPFFLHDTVTLLEGRGDVPVEHFVPFSVPVCLVKPPAGVSTADAYRVFDELAPATVDAGPLVAALRGGDAPAALAASANNMEAAAFRLVPGLADVYAHLDEQPALVRPPILCGSGSCVAGFMSSDVDAEHAAFAARERGWWACATRTHA